MEEINGRGSSSSSSEQQKSQKKTQCQEKITFYFIFTVRISGRRLIFQRQNSINLGQPFLAQFSFAVCYGKLH